ncbi:thiol-disulfide oxidoreductase DCC family protein [Sphingobacterium anhuiense]|uniref:Thiol-disulfide oxidoreductase DCC family protein n=1 Tax=Sphingobacterium anhuiense TaxID=493780 RepID=A0ABW5YZX1_9SPHI
MYYILFDGVCGFCNKSMIWIAKKDYQDKFYFISYQSMKGKELMEQYDLSTASISLIKQQKVYVKSDAVIEILRQIKKPFCYFTFIKIIPSFIRNFLYDLIARNRLHISKQINYCEIPAKDIKRKFL